MHWFRSVLIIFAGEFCAFEKFGCVGGINFSWCVFKIIECVASFQNNIAFFLQNVFPFFLQLFFSHLFRFVAFSLFSVFPPFFFYTLFVQIFSTIFSTFFPTFHIFYVFLRFFLPVFFAIFFSTIFSIVFSTLPSPIGSLPINYISPIII